jgi:hypothetical protein
MLGGDEDPCVPKGHLAHIKQTMGRDCPRVELDYENIPLAQVVQGVAHSPDSVLTQLSIDTEIHSHPPEIRRELARRVFRVFADEGVGEIIASKREQQSG